MAWQLKRWKTCDGGCSIRAPSFPDLANRGTVADRHPDFMAGDRFRLSESGGTSPDGLEWSGGNRLHKELWDLYESVSRRPKDITLAALEALPGFGQLFTLDWPKQGIWKGNAIQWFLDRDFGWPVRTPHIQAILNRMAELGIWKPNLYDSGISYDTVYTDKERAALGQEFHVTAEMTQAEKEAVPAACCHYWERV
jgi:hypothetical protein